MMQVPIPGQKTLALEHLIVDFNGTLALDGRLVPGVVERLRVLSRKLTVRVVTADTFGTAAAELETIPVQPTILNPEEQGEAKASLVERLGAGQTVSIGNGANDAPMLERAALGIVVNGPEGCARDAVLNADIVTPGILAALDLLINPERLVATLRR